MNSKLTKALAIVLATQVVSIAPVLNASEGTRHMAGVDVTEMVSLVITRVQGTEPVLERLGYKADRVTPYYETITIPAAEAKDLVPHLERLDNVRAVEEDYKTTYVPPEQITIARSSENWNYYEEQSQFAAEGPNDTYFIDQTAWMEPHENLAGVSDILRAWKASEKIEHLTVAIVDSGFDSHPDLSWKEGINLYFPTELADAQEYKRYRTACAGVSGANYHGQQVGAVVGAISGNGYGVSGILDADLVAVNVAMCDGAGVLSSTMDGIRWAAGDPNVGMYPISKPAKIINVSRGTGPGETDCPTYAQDAVDYAISRGSIVVISAGNYSEVPSSKIAPGNCEGVVTVANIGRSGAPSGSTSRGSAVELSAIGELVPAISPDGDERTLMFGTSFSAPTTTGAFGLLWQQIPELSADDVIKMARETARPLPGNPSDLGWGVVDAYRMLDRATTLLSEAPADYDHPERTGSVTAGLAQYLESNGYVAGACSAVEMDVDAQLSPGKHIVVFEVPEGEPLNRMNGTKALSSQNTRFLTNITAKTNSQFGYQICDDSEGQACSLDALIKVDTTGIGQGQNC